MSFWSQVGLLVAKSLRLERRTLEVIGVTLPFAVAALIAVALAVGIDQPLLQRIGPALFWSLVLLFSVLVVLRSSANETPGQRDMMKLLARDPAVLTVAAGLSSAAVMLVFEALLLPITMLLFNWVPASWWWVGALPLVALGLGLLGSLVNNVTRGVAARTSLAAILILPGSVPLLIAASRSLESSASRQGILPWLLLLLVMDLGLGIAVVALAGPIDDL